MAVYDVGTYNTADLGSSSVNAPVFGATAEALAVAPPSSNACYGAVDPNISPLSFPNNDVPRHTFPSFPMANFDFANQYTANSNDLFSANMRFETPLFTTSLPSSTTSSFSISRTDVYLGTPDSNAIITPLSSPNDNDICPASLPCSAMPDFDDLVAYFPLAGLVFNSDGDLVLKGDDNVLSGLDGGQEDAVDNVKDGPDGCCCRRCAGSI